MKWIHSLGIAFSMYSKIPVAKVRWTNEAMQYTFCFFPLVGVAEGALLWGMGMVLYGLRDRNRLPAIFVAIVLTILPLLVTGGIHMDGFLDTTDARRSYQEPEKKLAILKDPHTGAFALIGLGVYLLWSVAVWSVADRAVLPGMACAFVLSRTLSGLSVTLCKGAKKDGLAAAFHKSARERAVCVSTVCYLVGCAGVLCLTSGVLILALLTLTLAAVFGWYLWMADREFGGITGDLAGYFLQVFELAALTVLTAAYWFPAC